MMNNNKYRTRIAPSPTGYPHLGLIRTVLYNYALAYQSNGQFILRLEDTDTKRLVADAEEKLYEMLNAYGLKWNEGMVVGGPYAPYKQSERLPKYQEIAHKLVNEGFAYYAFDTVERLDMLRTEQEKAGIRTHYDNRDRDIDVVEAKKRVESGEKYCVRLKIPTNTTIKFHDPIGDKDITWESKDLDDIILLKSDGYPTYHLGVVVDDVEMKITHVFRGPEWIATTPYHIYLYDTLRYVKPEIIHVTVIFDPRTGKKFSKRDMTGMFLAEKYLREGYLVEGVLNYLMLLGWAPKDNREFFTLEEFVEAFDLKGLQKANPTFNQKKFDFFAGHYFRSLSIDDLLKRCSEWADKYEPSYKDIFTKLSEKKPELEMGIKMVQERAITFKSFADQMKLFFDAPVKFNIENSKGVKDLDKEKLKKIVGEIEIGIKGLSDDSKSWTHEEWEKIMRDSAKTNEIKDADSFMALRLAIVGEPFSPPLFEMMQILGKNECLIRISSFIKSLM